MTLLEADVRIETTQRLSKVADRRLRQPSEVYPTEIKEVPFQALVVTAVHSTGLGDDNRYGSTLGGARIKKIDFNDPTALGDVYQEVNELARDMSRKWLTLYRMLLEMQKEGKAHPWEVRSAQMGGGKTIIAVADYVEDFELHLFRSELLAEFAGHISTLDGKHITAVDMGTNSEDMDLIGNQTEYVACKTVENGGTGDPSPTTATGVWAGAKALMEIKGINPSQVTFAVQGVGNVGSRLISNIVNDYPNASVYVTDIDTEKIKTLQKKYPQVIEVAPEEFWDAPAELFMPCANPYVLNLENLQSMRLTGTAQIICGAANDQYPVLDGEPDPQVVRAFHKSGITVAPAPLVNLGGILHLSSAWWHEHGLPSSVDHHQRTNQLVLGVGSLIKNLYHKSSQENAPIEETYLKWVTETYASYLGQKTESQETQQTIPLNIQPDVLRKHMERTGISNPVEADERLRMLIESGTPTTINSHDLPRNMKIRTSGVVEFVRSGNAVFITTKTDGIKTVVGLMISSGSRLKY